MPVKQILPGVVLWRTAAVVEILRWIIMHSLVEIGRKHWGAWGSFLTKALVLKPSIVSAHEITRTALERVSVTDLFRTCYQDIKTFHPMFWWIYSEGFAIGSWRDLITCMWHKWYEFRRLTSSWFYVANPLRKKSSGFYSLEFLSGPWDSSVLLFWILL